MAKTEIDYSRKMYDGAHAACIHIRCHVCALCISASQIKQPHSVGLGFEVMMYRFFLIFHIFSYFLNSSVVETNRGATQKPLKSRQKNTMNLTTTFRILTAVLLVNESFAANVRSSTQRKLALPLIAGFEPSSDVTDLVGKCATYYHVTVSTSLILPSVFCFVSVEPY